VTVKPVTANTAAAVKSLNVISRKLLCRRRHLARPIANHAQNKFEFFPTRVTSGTLPEGKFPG
ncbi:MAG: hypothetical protein ABWZ19_00610, partial [Hyphomicrobium sp.]